MIPAKCHPEKKHFAKGFCKNCYELKWYRKHRKTALQRVNRYRIANRELLKEKEHAYYHENPARSILINCRQRARVRGIPFDLTIEDVVVPSHCPMLGIPLKLGLKKFQHGSPTLDRIDPKRVTSQVTFG